MSGLILLIALIGCFWLGRKLVRWVGQLVPNPRWKGPVEVMVALLLVVSPFIDELVGWYQFSALCKANGIESIDVSSAKGATVVRDQTKFERVPRKVIPIQYSKKIFRDVDTGEVLIQFNDYYAGGGWVARYFLNFNGEGPMLFDGNACNINGVAEIFSENRIIRNN